MTERRPSQYSREKRDQARALRRAMSDAEDKLWTHLRDREAVGTKFRRQHPVGTFILDFYCHQHRLAIEVDGSQHYEEEGLLKDRRRTAFLESQGIRMIRFNNLDVLQNIEGVMFVVLQALNGPSPLESAGAPGPHPTLSQRERAQRKATLSKQERTTATARAGGKAP